MNTFVQFIQTVVPTLVHCHHRRLNLQMDTVPLTTPAVHDQSIASASNASSIHTDVIMTVPETDTKTENACAMGIDDSADEEDLLDIDDKFEHVVGEFATDLRIVFPELTNVIDSWYPPRSQFPDTDAGADSWNLAMADGLQAVKARCVKMLPPIFFKIMYQDDSIFMPEASAHTRKRNKKGGSGMQPSATDATEFLPGISFEMIWKSNIGETTRDAIWKYLQLMAMVAAGNVDDADTFGDSAALFEAIHPEELQEKMQEAFDSISSSSGAGGDATTHPSTDAENEAQSRSSKSVVRIQEHINNMMDGNIGRLAREIANEAATEFDLPQENFEDMTGASSSSSCDREADQKVSATHVFKTLMSDQTKLNKMITRVRDKLQNDIREGRVKESELMQEARDMMESAGNIPGIGQMIKGMGGGKVNAGATKAGLDRQIKRSQLKERLREKMYERRAEQAERNARECWSNANEQTHPNALTDDELIELFGTTSLQSNPSAKNKRKH